MSHPSAVTAPEQAASKSFHAASLGPLAGLLVGAVALYVALRASDVDDFLRALNWGEPRTHIVFGAALGGALLAAWVVGAMARGRRVPVVVLFTLLGGVWLVGAGLSFLEVRGFLLIGDSMRLAERAGVMAGGMPLAFVPRLIGALAASGMLLASALALALSSRSTGAGGRIRGAVLGGLAAAPLLVIAGVAGLKGADTLAWAHAGLGLLLLGTCALAGVAVRSHDDGAAHRATQAVWLGAVGMMLGCVALSAGAYAQVSGGAGNGWSPLDLLSRLSWSAEQLGAMRWATGATLLVCPLLALGFTRVSKWREKAGFRTASGAVAAALILLVPVGVDTLVGALADNLLSTEWKVRAVPPGFAPVRLPGANAFGSTFAENTRPAAIHDADLIVVPGEARFPQHERFGGSVFLDGGSLRTEEGLLRMKEQLSPRLPGAMQRAQREQERGWKPAPAVSFAVDARVPMGTLARVIVAAHEAGADGLFFVGQSADHDDPAVRDTLRAHAPSLAPVLDAPLGVSTWFAPPADERASERLHLRARLTGAGPFEVSPVEGEGPSFQVDPERQLFPHSKESDTAAGVAPEGPSPVVLLSVGSAPDVGSFLRAAAALRARGFHVVLER